MRASNWQWIFLFSLYPGSLATSSPVHSISVGSGSAIVMELDGRLNPIRILRGFRQPTDVTPMQDGGLLVADAEAHEVLRLDPDGVPIWRERIGSAPRRARPMPGGGFVVSSEDQALVTDAERRILWKLDLVGLEVATALEDGNLLIAWNENGRGRLAESRADGSLEWLSREPFGTIVSVDAAPGGEIFTADFATQTLFLLAPDGKPLRSWVDPLKNRYIDTRFGGSGELVAVSIETQTVWLQRPDGSSTSWKAPRNMLPLCANVTSRGNLLVGLELQPDNEQLNASMPPAPGIDRAFRDTPLGAILLIGGPAALLGIALRLSSILAWLRRRPADGTEAEEPLAWPPKQPQPALGEQDWRRTGLLTLLALASLAGCLRLILWKSEAQAAAIGLWVAGQVLLLAAALTPPRPPQPAGTRPTSLALALLLCVAAGLRFWNLEFYPDITHWDHGIYGRAAMELLRGNWSPFFVMDPGTPSIPRPWVGLCAGLLKLLGHHYWVLRLDGAFSGVALVLAVYFLGSTLFNRRTGMYAALLATFHHVLLIHSRVPYILTPAPFFAFALAFACRGLKRGNRLDWCLAGFLSGWTLLTYWASSSLAIVGAAIFLGFVLFYPRWVYLRKAGMAWFILGALIVYGPMLPHMLGPTSLDARMSNVLAWKDSSGSFRWDASFWLRQFRDSFGSILFYPDHSAWSLSTGKPVCIGIEAFVLGAGLLYLLFVRGPALLLLACWIGVGVLLGATIFPDPQAFYHWLASVPPLLLLSAVALDRISSFADTRARWPALATRTLILLVLLDIAWLHLGSVNRLVRRRNPGPAEQAPIFHAQLRDVVPRYILDHPTLHHYLVRTPLEPSCMDPSFIFFTDGSDVSDLTGNLEDALPLPPVEPSTGAAFIVLGERQEEAPEILKFYPDAKLDQVFYDSHAPPNNVVKIYRVDAVNIQQVYQTHLKPRP